MPAWCCEKQVVACSPDWGYACFLLNIMLPGVGTMVSAACDKDQKCRLDVLLLGAV